MWFITIGTVGRSVNCSHHHHPLQPLFGIAAARTACTGRRSCVREREMCGNSHDFCFEKPFFNLTNYWRAPKQQELKVEVKWTSSTSFSLQQHKNTTNTQCSRVEVELSRHGKKIMNPITFRWSPLKVHELTLLLSSIFIAHSSPIAALAHLFLCFFLFALCIVCRDDIFLSSSRTSKTICESTRATPKEERVELNAERRIKLNT